LKQLINYILRFFVFWWLIFLAGKLFFAVINLSGFEEWIQFPFILFNGLRIDLSTMGYFIAIPLLSGIFIDFQRKTPKKIMRFWLGIFLFFTALVYAADPYFYSYWGQKANFSFIEFIKNDTAGILSVKWNNYLFSIVFFVLILVFGFRKMKMIIPTQKFKWWSVLIALPLVFIAIRGGISKVPVNVSSAYFSKINVLNNNTLNPVWNVMFETFDNNTRDAINLINEEEANRLLIKLNDEFKPINTDGWIDFIPEKTNVILLVLESFTAKLSGYLQDSSFTAMPHLDQLMKNSISFKRGYSSSFRSDKGLTALTTGFPSLANQTLTNFPSELNEKPNIFQIFNEKGYHTSFYYGGNIEFANIRVLFKDCDLLADEDYFDSDEKNAWGVHDHKTLDVFVQDLAQQKEPFFSTFFTLSSHEPFDVPNFKKHKEPLTNSIAYTDSCIGVFLSDLKKNKLWDNTLLVICADHGTTQPNGTPIFMPETFHIPILFSGGVVKKDTTLHNVVSQLDIPTTLNSLLDSSQNPFPYGCNIFRKNSRAFYTYHIGVVFQNDTCHQVFDIPQNQYIYGLQCTEPYEKAFYQISQKDFFRR